MTADESPRLFLSPCSNQITFQNLERGVLDGLDLTEADEPFGHIPLNDGSIKERLTDQEPIQEDDVHIWGLKERDLRHDLSVGDIILFYTGDRLYEYAAVVFDGFQSGEGARYLWASGDDQAPEVWDQLVVVSPPIPIRLSGEVIAEHGDYNIEWAISFSPLNKAGHESIRSQHGSIEAFVRDFAFTERNRGQTEPLDKIEDLSRRDPFKSEEKSTESEEESESAATGISELGPATTVSFEQTVKSSYELHPPWYDELATRLETTRQALLTGAPTCIGQRSIQRFLHWWGAKEGHPEIAENTTEIQLSGESSYKDLVETVDHGSGSRLTEDGPLKHACQLASAAATEAYYDDTVPAYFAVVVRGLESFDLSSGFGELTTLFDPTRRRRSQEILTDRSTDPETTFRNLPQRTLSGSGELIRIPPNLLLIGVADITHGRKTPGVDILPRVSGNPSPEAIAEYANYLETIDSPDYDPSEAIESIRESAHALRDLNRRIESALNANHELSGVYLEATITDSTLAEMKQRLREEWMYELLPRAKQLERQHNIDIVPEVDESPEENEQSTYQSVDKLIKSLASTT